MRFRKIVPTAAATSALAIGIAAGVVAPAQAYKPDPGVEKTYVETSDCDRDSFPLWCIEFDPVDNTYFKYDKGGVGTKMEFWDGADFVGKVEFHPYGEKLWLYDTKNDNDKVYVTLSWIDGNGDGSKSHLAIFPGGPNPVLRDLSIADGTLVDVAVYDNGFEKDLIGRMVATA